jgi:cobalt/nickel transport system permease protein
VSSLNKERKIIHISDGVLPAWVLIAGWVLTIILLLVSIYWAKKQTNDLTKKIPLIAVVTAVLFVICIVRIPMPPTSLHFMLIGLAGILLGPIVFVCVFISLLLQALLLQFGGVTALGVNTLLIGIPALLGYMIFKFISKTKLPLWVNSGLTGFMAVAFTTVSLAVVLFVAGVDFGALTAMLSRVEGIPILSHIARLLQDTPGLLIFFMIFLMYIPLMIIESIVSAFVIPFIEKVKPELLEQYNLKQSKPGIEDRSNTSR